jgi:hypothetical protein
LQRSSQAKQRVPLADFPHRLDARATFQSDTFNGYMLFRANFKSHSEADVQAAIDYGKRMKVYPIAQAANPPATVFVDVKDVDFDSTIRYDAGFLESLNRVVQAEQWIDRDRAMTRQASPGSG